ncbi:TonB-dependent receptor [Ignavibacteria bacterium]
MLLLGFTLVFSAQTSFAAVKKAAAQTIENGATLHGYVQDAATKETLISATVNIKSARRGAFTNKNGYFSINNIPPGKYTVTISFLGYKQLERDLIFEPKESKKITFVLETDAISTAGIAVEAEREIEKRQISISVVNIPMKQLTQLRVGGEADVFRALQFLPGILTSSQISSGLYVRGGSPDQNLVLLDGSAVYNPSHLFGFISTFNPEAIKDVEIIKGGYPAEYGNRLSAVLNLTQKDGNREHFEGLASLGLISSRASLQGPLGADGSWFLGGRRTYFDLLLGAMPEDKENPLPNFGFYDLNAKIAYDLGTNDKVFFSGFMSRDHLTLDGAGLEFGLGVGNRAGSIRWTHILGDELFTTVNFSASRYDNEFNVNNSGFKFLAQNSIADYTLKLEAEWFAGKDLTVKAGYEGSRFAFAYKQLFGKDSLPQAGTNTAGAVNLDNADYTHAVFGQANYQFTEQFSVQAGLRWNYWDSSAITTWDPRLALRYQASNETSIKFAYGIYHQYLRLATQPDFSFFDTWLPTDNSVSASKATHYILSLQTEPITDYSLNFDVYYKKLENISELNLTATTVTKVSDLFFSGSGEAYGAEIFLQKKAGNFTGWAGYGLGWVTARFDSINEGREFRPKYDRRHDLKLVGMYKINDSWEVGATFTFQSGQSYTAATSRFGHIMPEYNRAVSFVTPSERYGLRLPPSHQLNVSANYSSTLFDLPMRLLIDIYNVYSRRDIWFRYYDTSTDITVVKDVKLLPIIPTVSIEVKF